MMLVYFDLGIVVCVGYFVCFFVQWLSCVGFFKCEVGNGKYCWWDYIVFDSVEDDFFGKRCQFDRFGGGRRVLYCVVGNFVDCWFFYVGCIYIVVKLKF